MMFGLWPLTTRSDTEAAFKIELPQSQAQEENLCQEYKREAAPSIKVIIFNVDDVFWHGKLDANQYGKGHYALFPPEDNLELITRSTIQDRSDHRNFITLYDEIPEIISDISKRGMKIGILSDGSDKALCDRTLWHFQSLDANNHSKPIISFIAWDEVGRGSKMSSLIRICDWSCTSREEILFFDSNPGSREISNRLGIRFELVEKAQGLKRDVYQRALTNTKIPSIESQHMSYNSLYYDQPPLGRRLGEGRFGAVYDSPCESQVVIKVMNGWTSAMQYRYTEVYDNIRRGKFITSLLDQCHRFEGDEYLYMIAHELQNLRELGKLKSPKPENFSGWFKMTKAEGTPIWGTKLYRKYPFSVPFQTLLRLAFHLIVDEIEVTVQKYGIEHRDPHLANVHFIMKGNLPIKAMLFDWGITARMKWNGEEYVRDPDTMLWNDDTGETRQRYTEEEFREYWISWMVRTEYEALASPSRGRIEKRDALEFTEDLSWWFRRTIQP